MKTGIAAWHDEADDVAGNDWMDSFDRAEVCCQSEIEKGLFVTYLMLLRGRHLNDPPDYIITDLEKIEERPSPTARYATVDICIPQFPVPGTKYRADLAVKRIECLSFKDRVTIYQTPIVIVECDGHDFHERTPDQAAHDKSRDRAICTAGFVVIRFTGREIHRDALKCANEIDELLMERLNDEMEAHAARVFKEKHPDLVTALEEEAKASVK